MNKLICIIVLFAACMPKEEPIVAFDRGDVQEVFINSGSNKNTVVFYDLETSSTVAEADPSSWDIYIANDHVKVNYHRFVKYASFTENMEQQLDTVGLNFLSGQKENEPWVLSSATNYVLDLGIGNNAKHLGFYKISYELSGGKVQIQISELEGQFPVQYEKTEGYLNLRTNEDIDLPLESEYDISFGKYVHYFEVEKLDYEVYGALTPNTQTRELSLDFDKITQSTTDTISWANSRIDEVGYDWKYYSLDKNAYEIDPLKNFVLKTADGFVYKLRFVNFYDTQGQSGHPSLEFKLL